MIKKILYTFLPVCLLTIGFAGCDDDVMDPLPETVPLIVEASAKSFVMGEELTLTLKVNDAKNPDRVPRILHSRNFPQWLHFRKG